MQYRPHLSIGIKALAWIDPANIPVGTAIHHIQTLLCFIAEKQELSARQLHLHYSLANRKRWNFRLHLCDDDGLQRVGLRIFSSIGGEIISFLSSSLRAKYSSNTNSKSWPVKFVEKFSGVFSRIFGGVISFSPPTRAPPPCWAQAIEIPIIAINKKKFPNVKFNGGGDLCLPTIDGKIINPRKIPNINVPIYQYDALFRTKGMISKDRARFARAWFEQR